MIAAVRVELLKLRTTRSTLGFFAAAVGITALLAVLETANAGTGSAMAIPSLATPAGLRDGIASTGFALLVAAVFGTSLASSEFRLKTITDTYLDDPNRTRVMASKAIAGAAGGALLGVASAATALTISLVTVSAHHYQVALSAGTIFRFAAGAVVGSALLAAAGVGVGSLIRNQVAAVIVVFAWGLAVEEILGASFSSVGPYLPYTAAAMTAGVTNGGGMPPIPRGIHPLSFVAVVALLAGIVVILSAISLLTTLRRDVY
jgi:ABC-type transport system involved in multi-copper enzyme maturation permease subunit